MGTGACQTGGACCRSQAVAGTWGTGTLQGPVTVTDTPSGVIGSRPPNTPATVRLDLTPDGVSLSAPAVTPFPIREATTMAPSTSTEVPTVHMLDGVITTDLSLFACRVPTVEDQPEAYTLADRLMDYARHDQAMAVRVGLARALETATEPTGRTSRAYLAATLVILHTFGHPTHRKG